MNTSLWPIRRSYRAPSLTIRGRTFDWGARTYLMGIINATPDSFSGDGVLGSDADPAVRAREFAGAGADMLDIGAESTRPDAEPIGEDEELRRLLPVLEAVRAATDLPISVDTYHARIAALALEHGADFVNDIWGMRFDPDMADVVAQHGVPIVAMHNQRGREFRDVEGDIRAGWCDSLELAAKAGIPEEHIILDPGFGFGWKERHNLEMLRRLPEVWDLRYPLLVGTSRKSTIGSVLDRPVTERVEGTAATVSIAIAAGTDIVRVHDVAVMAQVARMTDAIVRGA